MAAEQIAFQITFASVDSADSADPRGRAERILREARVLAAIRGDDDDVPTLLIPVTENAQVLALEEDGRLRFDLSAARLEALFAGEGLTLHLGILDAHDAPDGEEDTDEVLEAVDAELEEEFGEAFHRLEEVGDDLPDFGAWEDGDALITQEPVRVAEFSRRGPWAARVTAQLLQTPVEYLEAAAWSVYRYRTDRAHGAVSGGGADGPIIEVNVPQRGEAWVEVTGRHGRTAMLWPNAERLTRPVLDIGAIAVPESAELYRRMLSVVDGAQDELDELRLGDEVDADAVRRACLPEALGGTAGADARLRAVVAAFGVPSALVDAGLDATGGGRRFVPRGWSRTAIELVLGGLVEVAPLVHRDRPVVRFARFLRKHPAVGAALSVLELMAGARLAAARSRLGRGVGVVLVIDSAVDLAVWVVRIRRR